MMIIDCHVHSDFSFDGKMTPQHACLTAMSSKLPLDGLAFVDHLDLDFPGYDDSITIDYDEYFSALDRLKQSYQGRFKILAGGEIGVQPHTAEKTRSIIKGRGFDFLIGSVHIIDHMDPIDSGFYAGRSQKASFDRYLQELSHMIDYFDDFNVLGHFDYITRYSPFNNRCMKYRNHSGLFDEVFTKLIHKGKGIEINTGSYRESPNKSVTHLDTDIIKRYKELGGEIICLGSDAHTPEYIGYKFDYFRNILVDIGFKYLVHFERRVPVFDSINA